MGRHSRFKQCRWLPLLLAAALLGASLTARAQQLPRPPEAATDRAEKALATARQHMIAAANPYATDAGLEILRAGGSAVDAAIAVQLVLGLVEPQSSGLGGGAFLLHWDAAKEEVRSYDGREVAPAAARPDRFMRNGRRLLFEEAVFSGLSIGVPGTVRLLELAHSQHGRLPWARLFEPAIKLAEAGFRVSPRLSIQLRLWGARNFAPAARTYFFDDAGSARPIGHLLRNPQYARTLRTIAERGAAAFYSGEIAEAIVAASASAPNRAGDMTLEDLARYAAKERPPVCFPYRARRICGMGPPSSGGLSIAMILKLLEPSVLGEGPRSTMRADALHAIAEAEKLAYADRDRYMADPDFVAVPTGLLDDGYLASRRRLIDPQTAMARPIAGVPPGADRHAFGEDATREAGGTTHFSIVDREGNAVAMTSTIESAFGSRVWAAGFLLNNELTDFSFRPTDAAAHPVANAVGPGKRPRSSMSPTLVFGAGGELEATLGSVGGTAIIYYVVKALVAVLDWQLDAQAAATLINFGSRGGPFEIDLDAGAIWQGLKVKPFGHHIALNFPISGTHIIVRRGGVLEGGADPRREGVAKGD